MDFLFDFNKACMNEESHRLTDVSATQGDKQGRAGGRKEGGGRERGRWERGWEEEKKKSVCVCVFSSATPFQVHGTVGFSQRANKPPKKRKKKTLFLFPRPCA